MNTFNFNNRNVSVSLTYDDLQRLMKECVSTAMREMQEAQKKMENQKWFCTKDTAKMFGVDVSTINRWKHSGYLTPRTVGGRDFFSVEEINQHLLNDVKRVS